MRDEVCINKTHSVKDGVQGVGFPSKACSNVLKVRVGSKNEAKSEKANLVQDLGLAFMARS
jgi:uncharacterized protein (UPF0335 family)